MRRLLATVSVFALAAAPAAAQQTPGQNQQQINGLPWTNGMKDLTGAQLQSLFTNINGTFSLYGSLSGTNNWLGAQNFYGTATFPTGAGQTNIGSVPFSAIGNGATGSASAGVRAGDTPNLLRDYGAHGDALWQPFAVTCNSGSGVITFAQTGSSSAPAFSSADVGKTMTVPGCGGAYWAYGRPTIVSAGSGYVFGEIVTLAGGTGAWAAKLIVTKTSASDGRSAGGIVNAYLYDPGDYSTAPSGTISQASSNKSGTGATFTLAGFQSALTGTITAASGGSVTLNVLATVSQSGVVQTPIWFHDDLAAFNAALAALVNNPGTGGGLYLPQPPGMCYGVSGPITLPSGNAANEYANSVTIFGASLNTSVCAGAPMEAQIQNAGTFNAGYKFETLELDGRQLAVHNVNLTGGVSFRPDVYFFNAASGGSNILTSYTLRMIGDTIENPNYNYADLGHLPTMNVDLEGADSSLVDNVYWGAQFCGIYDNGTENKHTSEHPFSYPSSQLSAYNACSNADSQWYGNTFDSASAGGMLIGGYGAQVVGNRAQGSASASITVPIGFEIANGIQDALVANNRSDTGTVTKTVQVDGGLGVYSCVVGNVGLEPSTYYGNVAPYANCGPVQSGEGNTIGILSGCIFGPYNLILGTNACGFGSGVDDFYRQGWIGQASGGGVNYGGDNQTGVVEMNGFGTSGTVKITTGNTSGSPTLLGPNEFLMRIDIVASELLMIDISAVCSTGDAAGWHLITSGSGQPGVMLVATKSKASVAPLGTPAFALVSETTGASTGGSGGTPWSLAFNIDGTNGAAYLTGTGTCINGGHNYTIDWTIRGTTVESGSGAN
jgi:hypothetical protein